MLGTPYSTTLVFRFAGVIVTLFAATTAEATTIYTFPAGSTAPTTVTANAAASNFQFYNSTYACPPAGGCGSYGNSTDQFSVAPLAGFTLNVTGFSFDERNPGSFPTSPNAFHVFTSADGFTSPILSGTLSQNAVAFTTHSTSLSLLDITGPLVVRIVASGREGLPQHAWLLDNVTLHATAMPVSTAVPEPTSLVLLGTGIGMVAARRRFRGSRRAI